MRNLNRIGIFDARILRRTALLAVAAFVIPACGSGSSGGGGPAAIVLGVSLGGGQEVGPVTTAATGTATVTVNGAQTQIDVVLTTASITGVTAAHIHSGAPGTNGPIAFNLFTGGTFISPLSVTLIDTDLQGGSGFATFADAVNAILTGQTYINVHTGTNPGGEIRGHIGPGVVNVTLTGGEEVPAVTTTASGTATLTLNGAQTRIDFTVTVTGLTGGTDAHIHNAAAGANGPIIFYLAPGGYSDNLAGSLTPTAAEVNTIMSNLMYFNVHSTGNPGGEIRGQIVP